MSFWKRNQAMGTAALILGISVLLSRVMGLVRDKVISYYFGASPESDVYFAAFVIPDFINYLLAGGYFSITLIPLLARRFAEDRADGWRLFSCVFLWTVAAISAVTLVAEALAPQLAALAAPGLGPAGTARLALFLRIILPAQVFFLAGSCVMAVLYLRKQFVAPALAPLVYNLSIIGFGVAFRGCGMEGFCWGVLAGSAVGNFLIPCLIALAGEGLPLRWTAAHPQLKRFFALAVPLMLAQSIVIWDEQLVRVFGSLAGAGAISCLNYARRIMMVPVGAVAQAAGVASFPFLAELLARGDRERFHATVNGAIRSTLLLLIPLSVWMMVVAGPTVTLVFRQGQFDADAAARTATLLRLFLVVVFCWGIQQIVGRAFYAGQDTVTPAVIGTAVTLLAVPLFLGGAAWLGETGVAGASVAGMVLYTAALAARWRRVQGPLALAGVRRPALRLAVGSALCGMPSGLAAAAVIHLLPGRPYAAALAAVAASSAVYAPLILLALRWADPEFASRHPLLRRVPGFTRTP